MVEGAEGNDVFVADLLAQAPALGEAEMVGMRGLATAHEAGQFRDVLQMFLVADPAFKTEPEFGFVDLQAAGNLGQWQEVWDRRDFVRRWRRHCFFRTKLLGRRWHHRPTTSSTEFGRSKKNGDNWRCAFNARRRRLLRYGLVDWCGIGCRIIQSGDT